VREVLINNHHLPEQVRAFINSCNSRNRFKVSEAYEQTLLGSAGTITANRDFADDTDAVLIIYADNLSNIDLVELLEYHVSHDDPFTMMLFHTPYPSKCGIAALDSDQRVIEFVEKPTHPTSDLANGGVYVVDAQAYRTIADMNVFDLGFDVLPRFIGKMRGWTWNGYHRDIGTLESLELARKEAPGVFQGAKAHSA
jgi:mannose-1-phosphate guanylyltransferase